MAITAETLRQFETEKQAYWQLRDTLLTEYRGKFVAIADGKVVAVGEQMNWVAAEADRRTGNRISFVTLVGDEDFEIRIRATTAIGFYDTSYRNPIPTVIGEVSDPNVAEAIDVEFIVDTGADISVLHSSVADQLNLWLFPRGLAHIGGLTGVSEQRMLYRGSVCIAEQVIPIVADCGDDIDENILGRDVLNEFALTVCAKREEVTLEWVD